MTWVTFTSQVNHRNRRHIQNVDLGVTTIRFSQIPALHCDEAVNHAVEVVEESKQVERKFNPPFSLQWKSSEQLNWLNHLSSLAPGTCSMCRHSWWRWGRRGLRQTSPGGSCTWEYRGIHRYLRKGLSDVKISGNLSYGCWEKHLWAWEPIVRLWWIIPMDVVADERRVEQNAKPLSGDQEQEVEENVQDIPEWGWMWEGQW